LDTSKIIEFGTTATLRKRQQPTAPNQFTELVWNNYVEDGVRIVTVKGAGGQRDNSTASGLYHEGRTLRDLISEAMPRIRRRIDAGLDASPEYFRINHPEIYKRVGDDDLRTLATPLEDWDSYFTAESQRHRQARGLITDFVIDAFHHSIPLERDYIANCVHGGKLKK